MPDLVVGAGQIDRRLSTAENLLTAYRTDDGLRYLNWRPRTDPDRLWPEDLAVTILINSRVGPAAFKSVQDSGDGFAASVATKVLHKKRPRLVPILDNQAIFGASMNPRWPERRSATVSIYTESRIRTALEWIWTDLTRQENTNTWCAL